MGLYGANPTMLTVAGLFYDFGAVQGMYKTGLQGFFPGAKANCMVEAPFLVNSEKM